MMLEEKYEHPDRRRAAPHISAEGAPMTFADLHNHTLFGVDDGPGAEAEMFAMLDAAWADGTRMICLTPHCHPGYFGDTRPRADRAFESLTRYAAEKYPDMRLFPGNELRYSPECLSWLASGVCRTLNWTDYVLVDFFAAEPAGNIIRGLERLLSAGYRPVLAHAERYGALSEQQVRELSRNGVWIQIDVQSLFGTYGLGSRLRSRNLLKKKLVDIAATDAHDLGRRSPLLSRGYREVVRKYGEAYANAIFADHPRMLLTGEDREGAIDRE